MIICVIDSYAKNTFDSLEIHVFNVQQGDSQLVVFPSGYSMLIDAGETSSKSTNYKAIAKRVEEILGDTHVDVALLTHLHADHYGSTYSNGFYGIFES